MNRLEHLLTIVAEEGAEVAQRADKALRFGLYEVQPGQDQTNLERLLGEYHDLMASIGMVLDDQRLPFHINPELLNEKRRKVEKFLAYSRELGTLT